MSSASSHGIHDLGQNDLAILSTLVGTTPAETAFGHMINLCHLEIRGRPKPPRWRRSARQRVWQATLDSWLRDPGRRGSRPAQNDLWPPAWSVTDRILLLKECTKTRVSLSYWFLELSTWRRCHLTSQAIWSAPALLQSDKRERSRARPLSKAIRGERLSQRQRRRRPWRETSLQARRSDIKATLPSFMWMSSLCFHFRFTKVLQRDASRNPNEIQLQEAPTPRSSCHALTCHCLCGCQVLSCHNQGLEVPFFRRATSHTQSPKLEVGRPRMLNHCVDSITTQTLTTTSPSQGSPSFRFWFLVSLAAGFHLSTGTGHRSKQCSCLEHSIPKRQTLPSTPGRARGSSCCSSPASRPWSLDETMAVVQRTFGYPSDANFGWVPRWTFGYAS